MIDYGVTIPNYLECFPTSLFVENIEYGERKTKNGILIHSENMDYEGNFVRPRWAKVRYKADNIDFVKIGDWILLPHGNWSTSMKVEICGNEQKLWYINPKCVHEIMAISKTMPKHLKEYGFEE